MATESTSRRRFPIALAWVGVALLLGQALVGHGTLPGHALDPLVHWYAAHEPALRATSFLVALISLGLLGSITFRGTGGSRRWVPILIGLLLAALATSSATLLQGDLLDVLQKLAQLAATLIGIYLVFVAGPRELARWRRTKYDERSAEAAAAALIATEDLLTALDGISSPFLLKGDAAQKEGEPHLEFIRKWFGERLERIEPQRGAFRQARVQAQVYLEDEHTNVLDAVADHYNDIVDPVTERATFMEVETLREKGLGAYRRLFRELPQERSKLRLAAKTALIPIARYRTQPS